MFWQFQRTYCVFFFLGCTKDWLVNGTYCYKVTNYRPKNLKDAQKICQDMSADLPIIKSEQENVFIAGLITNHTSFVRLGMKREKGQLLWFDGASAERSNITARYNAWGDNQPSNKTGENCAYIGFTQKWNDKPCNYNSIQRFGFINGVDNVNWPPYRDSKS